MEDTLKLIDAIKLFIEAPVGLLGPWGTVGVLVSVYLAFAIRRVYLDWRKGKEVHLAIAEMEKSVQRSAAEAREWRILFLKDKHNWTDDQVGRFVSMAEYQDGPTARRALENKHLPETSGDRKKRTKNWTKRGHGGRGQ